MNCGLCVLSNYAPLTNVFVHTDSSELNAKFHSMDEDVRYGFAVIDAFHLAGAVATLHPLWNMSLTSEAKYEQLGRFAHLLFMIKFYSELPKFSSKRSAASYALRSTQLWLRDAGKADVADFISRMPLQKDLKERILNDLITNNDILLASNTEYDVKRPNLAAGIAKQGSEKDGSLFGHFFYYGAFILNGHGGNIHHPKLTGGFKKDQQQKVGGIHQEISNNKEKGSKYIAEKPNVSEEEDDDSDDIDFEISALRAEGNFEQADALEVHRRSEQLNELKHAVSHVSLLRWGKKETRSEVV